MSGTLYIVSTPIGNYDDITLRALKSLKSADIIICEEYKPARRMLAFYNIDKELISLNEHNEEESAPEIIKILKSGKSAALISDCGTPLFSDPGHYLLNLCINQKINLQIVPGVNSLIPALTGSGLHAEKFYYFGWLSPKKNLRRKELLRLKSRKELIAVMETPYRLKTLLFDVKKILGANQKIVLAYKITTNSEKFFRGTVSEIHAEVERKNLKGEFILLIDNRAAGKKR